MKWEVNRPKTEFEITVEPEVILPEAVYAKMMGYIDAVDGEISGMGEVQREGNLYIVTDIWLLKQECTGASTSIDAVSLADLRAEVYQQGKAKEGFQLWWHSHANMDTFWSGTDKSTMQMFMADIDWMLFIVANKKRSVRARVEYRNPVQLVMEDIKVAVTTQIQYDMEAIKAEVAQKVSSQKWGSSSGVGFHGRQLTTDLPPRKDWTDKDTPIDRGDAHWEHLPKRDKKMVRRYANEESPMCLYLECQVCHKKNFCFYVKSKRQCVCLGCIEDWEAAARKGTHVTYHTPPFDIEAAKKEAEKKPETNPTPPGMNAQDDNDLYGRFIP